MNDQRQAMFNKEGVPFFIIIIPFFCLLFLSFFAVSYHQKISTEAIAAMHEISSQTQISVIEKENLRLQIEKQKEKQFTDFIIIITTAIMFFMALFSLMMNSIVQDIITKYKETVKTKELSLRELNQTLEAKVAKGIEEGKAKDKAILRESRLARLGAMLSMIAHQWRQPLSELSGILMELEMAVKFKRMNEDKLLRSLERSNERIEYMSGTIDDFRNFYKPDKTKTLFLMSEACEKALALTSAAFDHASISATLIIKKELPIMGYPSEFSQAILNLLSNAKDILVERNIPHPTITITINTSSSHNIMTVEDNGGGIDESSIERIFDPYFSTKDATAGTGLGLYIAKVIVEENMYGIMDVHNNAQGAVFTIMFERSYHG